MNRPNAYSFQSYMLTFFETHVGILMSFKSSPVVSNNRKS